jgi:glycosyltransferase involved in cell wall biosynthesis
MKKINLIFFLPEFIRGGAANSILSLCKNLKKNKFNIHIISLEKFEYNQEFKKIAIVYKIPVKKTLFAQNYIQKIIHKVCSNNLNTIFISNLFHANVLTAIFQKKRKNLKFVFTERTTLSELFIYFSIWDFIKKTIIKILIKFFYNQSDLIIANSKKVANDLERYSNCKSTYIYPGTFNKFYKKKYINYYKKKQNIIWIGRIAKEKGVESLIDVFKKIDKKKYNLKILGEGPLKNRIISKIKKSNLKGNIKVLGFKKNTAIYLKKSDLLINTSFFEGFPNVVIEALSNSVPVICSQSEGGINEILLNGKLGDIYNQNKSNDLYLKIVNFLKNPKILNVKASKAYKNLKRFDKKYSAKKYEKIFYSIKF